MDYRTPKGMSRRHFMNHLAGASAMAGTALAMGNTLYANSATLKKNRKAAILLWMGGGPSTIDIWDMKPCLLYTSPSPRDATLSRMPSSA